MIADVPSGHGWNWGCEEPMHRRPFFKIIAAAPVLWLLECVLPGCGPESRARRCLAWLLRALPAGGGGPQKARTALRGGAGLPLVERFLCRWHPHGSGAMPTWTDYRLETVL